MDIGATIVGIAIILICIIPFVLMSRSNRKKEQKLLQGLFDYAEQKNCKISQYDSWRHSTIGIDNTSLMIFFTKKVKEETIFRQINLAEIQKCQVINSGKTVSHSNSTHKIIEKLELAFTYWDKGRKESVLEFYNTEYHSLTLTGELQLVEKWCEIFNDKISTIAKQKS